MSTFTLEAQCVTSEHPDGECHLVSFADRNHGTKLYLMLQRAFEHDEQDVALGMDTFHVEWCGQKGSRYGGIHKFEIRPGMAEIAFDTETAELFDGLTRLRISFQLPPAEYAALQEALGHIFRGSGSLQVVDA